MNSIQGASLRAFGGSLAAVVTIAVFAGCGGSQSQLPSPSSAQANGGAAYTRVIEPGACKYDGGVRAAPCFIRLTPSKPGPVTVTLRTPHGSKGQVTENDTCGEKGVAVVTGSGDTWSVSAGTQSGKCRAKFSYFNNKQKVGWALVRIQNV